MPVPTIGRVFLLFFGVAVLAVTACHRSSGRESEISVRQQVTPQPVRVGPATITIQIADAAQKPVSPATIMVEADMSHPGMGPVFAEAEETAPGSYQAHIGFNMGGDWVVLLHIKLPDGRKIERQMDVRGVQSN
jgi:YtkA-like